jgi:Ca-activated chloride channel family protein
MTFGRPLALLLLAAPVLLILWETLRTQRRVALPFDHGHQPSGRWLGRLVYGAHLMPPVLLAMAIIIYSRPLRQDVPKQERALTNIELLLDVSGSMTSQFGKGSRYDASIAAMNEFTSRRKGDAFGLAIFGNEVLQWAPLTKDLSALRSAAPFLRPESLPPQFGGTEIGKALRYCANVLSTRGEGDRLIVILTDGESADLGPAISKQIGGELAAAGIMLYAVHIGDAATPSDLYDLARPCGGQVFPAAEPDALATIFDHIDHMQPVKLHSTAPQHIDLFGPWVIAGLTALGFYGVSLWGVRYTPW